jgi:hypothetical protein
MSDVYMTSTDFSRVFFITVLTIVAASLILMAGSYLQAFLNGF